MFLFLYIFVGLILGPSLLKISVPEEVFTMGAFGFLFFAGLELNIARLRQEFMTSAKVATGAFVLPFLMGLLYAFFFFERSGQGAFVIAVALAISALPIVVQILRDLGIYDSRLGHVIVAAATLCDVAAWVIFTAMIPNEERSQWVMSHLPVVFFFVGLGLSPMAARSRKVLLWARWGSRYFFGPLFFVGVGAKIHLQENFDLTQCLTVFLFACLGKIAGAYVSGRLTGFVRKEALLMAMVLNARGAMEILFCTIAYKLGMIDGRLFTSLTIMAVASSLVALPVVRILFPRNPLVAKDLK